MNKQDEIIITVINGLLELTENTPDDYYLGKLKFCLEELKETFNEKVFQETEKEIENQYLGVYISLPYFNVKSIKKVPVIDGNVTIEGQVLEDILTLSRRGYIKEEDYKRKLIDDLNQLITNSFNSGSISH